MRVIMTSDAIGSVWTYTLELVRALRSDAAMVVVVTMGPRPSASQRADAQRIDNLVLVETDYRLEWMRDPWHDVECSGAYLLGLEAALEPAIVHLNGYAHANLPFRTPRVVVAHSAHRDGATPEERERRHNVVRAGLHAAEAVVAPTQWMRASLERDYGALPFARVIPNGRSPESLLPMEKEPMVLAAARRWDASKNLAVLESIARRVPWPIVVAGDTSIRDDAPRSGPRGVHALGRLEDDTLFRWLRRAAIYALPTRYEPFGSSVLEAGLAQCALVLGDIESLREVWGDAAIYVDPDDGDGLVRALGRLIADPKETERRGLLARERALSLSPQIMAREYLTLYRELSMPRARARPSPGESEGTVPGRRTLGS